MPERPPRKRVTTPPKVEAEWLADNYRALLAAGLAAPLSITVERQTGPYADHYWLTMVEGGWKLEREGDGGEDFVTYYLARDFSTCDCPSWALSACDCCKHTEAAKQLAARRNNPPVV